MVSYYNPMAMYRQQGHVAPGGQLHPNAAASPPTPNWYGGYHHHHHSGSQVPNAQQFLSCIQDTDSQQISWHHPHPVFNEEFFNYNNYIHQQQPQLANKSPQLPSPPISSSELSSPGGAPVGTVTPPIVNSHHSTRPGPVRSPYDWITKPSYQNQPNPGKTRTKDKYRVVYTDHQRLELEKEFCYSRYITIRRKAELAANLGLSERQVKIWFQNRRAKERKQQKKRDELSSKTILNSNLNGNMQLQQELLHHQHHHHHQAHHHQHQHHHNTHSHQQPETQVQQQHLVSTTTPTPTSASTRLNHHQTQLPLVPVSLI